MQPNKERIALWVAALRYPMCDQGFGSMLTMDGRTDPLGVACGLSGLGLWVPEPRGVIPDSVAYVVGEEVRFSYLPTEVARFYGLGEGERIDVCKICGVQVAKEHDSSFGHVYEPKTVDTFKPNHSPTVLWPLTNDQLAISYINDEIWLTFSEIADEIERTYIGK